MNPSSNIIKWSGFVENDEKAQEHLEQKLLIISKSKLIVSSKKEFQLKRSNNLLLFKFTVITADK
jgi:hypothetical protein